MVKASMEWKAVVDSGKRCLEKTSWSGSWCKVQNSSARVEWLILDMSFSPNSLGKKEEWVNDIYDVVGK
jgi:hypothetical protein